ncbi:MAG: hypothetical protein Q9170_005915 [Blastenia crenularia]
MGNTSTKEQRAEARRPRHLDPRSFSSPNSSGPNSPANPSSAENSSHQFYSSRTGRGSRPDLSVLLGLGNHSNDNAQTLEARRETKQEREARKLEKERTIRLKERERSMREEHVDGGYLVTQGVYTGIEDFDKKIVRQLMIERRLAPFWRGLNDYSDSWTENQLIAAARGLPIPAADEIPKEEETGTFTENDRGNESRLLGNENSLTVPITSRSASYGSDSPNRIHGLSQFSPPDLSQANHNPGIFRGRAKTLASLTTSSKQASEAIIPAEIQLPNDPYINGQRVEVFLYKDTFECPICLIYYPAFGNKTRCCDQWICSECFVQIKRPDPHPPEHVDPSAPPPPPPLESGEGQEEGEQGELVSEPATCPFCKQAEFGITYEPPPFRRGLAYVNQPSGQALGRGASAMSSSTSLSSGISGGQLSPTILSRRRTTSVSATDSSVITTDRVRPDWHRKLMSARAHASRRSAAATALHTAAYLMGDRGYGEGRGFGALGRRGLLRRGSGSDFPSGAHASAHASMMALLSERHAAGTLNRIDGHEWSPAGPSIAPPRGSSRRDRMEDIEDMMMMEAIRLSLASEEERHKQEDKVAKKEAKKAEKEAKKREKAAKKAEKAAGLYSNSANQSITGFSSWSESSLAAAETSSSSAIGKGKAAQRTGTGGMPEGDPSPWNRGRSDTDFNPQSHPFIFDPQADPQTHLERARAQLKPELQVSSLPFGSSAYRPSHLRTTSNVSSSASSVNESLHGSLQNPFQGSSSSLEPSPSGSGINLGQASSSSEGVISGTPPGGGAGLEPMFNFRSLAEMVKNDDRAIQHGPVSTTEDEQESSYPRDGSEEVTVAETERSDSMATVQAPDEFHESSEYPQSNRNSLNQPPSGTGNEHNLFSKGEAHAWEVERVTK